MLGNWGAWRWWWSPQRCRSRTLWELGITFVWKPFFKVDCYWLLCTTSEIHFEMPLFTEFYVFLLLISRLGLRESALGSDTAKFRKSSQSRLLCFVVTAIAKLATYHRELLPRARVSLAKVSVSSFYCGSLQRSPFRESISWQQLIWW